MGSWLDAIGGALHVTLAAASDWLAAGKVNSHSPKRFGSLSCCAGRQGAGGRFTSWHDVTPATDIAPDSNILPPSIRSCATLYNTITQTPSLPFSPDPLMLPLVPSIDPPCRPGQVQRWSFPGVCSITHTIDMAIQNVTTKTHPICFGCQEEFVSSKTMACHSSSLG